MTYPKTFRHSLCAAACLLGGGLGASVVQAEAVSPDPHRPVPYLQVAEGDDSGGSLMERGADLFLRGLRDEMAPAFDGLQDLLGEIGPSMGEFLSEMGPALSDIARQVEDWSAYELPEMLPNGDIIIRKKQREDAPDKDFTDDDGNIEI